MDLRKAVQGILVGLNWPHSAEIDRTLREQLVQLSKNIEVLNERYTVPTSEISESAVAAARTIESTGFNEDVISLDDLIAQYRTVLGTIGTLIMEGSDRERGKLILTQVARSHEEMATNLAKFLPEPTLVHPVDTTATIPPTTGEARWENEGGAPHGVAILAATA